MKVNEFIPAKAPTDGIAEIVSEPLVFCWEYSLAISFGWICQTACTQISYKKSHGQTRLTSLEFEFSLVCLFYIKPHLTNTNRISKILVGIFRKIKLKVNHPTENNFQQLFG